MAKKKRNRRSARKARSQERIEREAALTGASIEEVKQSQLEKNSRPKQVEAKRKSRVPGFIRAIGTYFSDSRAELRRVTWPSRRELRNYSVSVICSLVAVGAAIWLVDTGIVAILVVFSSLGG